MKFRLILLVNSLLLIIASILFFFQDNTPVKIIVNKQIKSILGTSEQDRFSYEILTNKPNSYYFNIDYISNVSIENDQEQITINPIDILKQGRILTNKEEEYYQISLIFTLSVLSNNLEINYQDAQLVLHYVNNESITLNIGEFNYIYKDWMESDLTLGNLIGTHEMIDGLDTISGVYLELGNASNSNITIKSIDILSSHVTPNLFHTSKMYEIISYKDQVKTILGMEYYDFTVQNNDMELNMLLLRKNTLSLYIPFSYVGEIQYLHRFPIRITYELNNEIKEMIIDDFPFMKTSIYGSDFERFYEYYEINN